MQDWSFDKKGEARCDYSNGYHYLVGFERDGTDNLKGMKKKASVARKIKRSGTHQPNVNILIGSGQWMGKTHIYFTHRLYSIT